MSCGLASFPRRAAPRGLLLAAAALLASLAAVAADAPALAACQACHGRDGISESAEIPNLAGQKPAYLVKQLQAFRAGTRKNDLMAAIAGQLGDDEMRALAAQWSRLPGPAASASGATGSVAAIRSRMTFPAGFPAGFTLYETISEPGSGQVARRYANAVALQAAREGKPLGDGAAIVVVNHAVELDAAHKPVLDTTGKPVAGKVLSYAGMAVRAGWGQDVPALLRNGDWDYALFAADGTRRDGLNEAPCLACHKPIAADSYVFTLQALRAAATR